MNKEVKSQRELKFLNSGSYGCTFRPGLKCDGTGSTTEKFITKIQVGDETSKREVEIGEKVRQIDKYQQYYAPIMKNCNVSLSTVSKTEIEKCKILQNKSDDMMSSALTYEANKIRYVGKNTLIKHLLNVYSTRSMGVVRELVNCHNILLTGFNKLADAGIIHFDVKENNVICEDNTGRPIIIDFGLSADVATIEEKEYKEAFYIYGPEYAPWCIELVTIAYAVNEIEDVEGSNDSIAGFIGFGEKVETKDWKEQQVKQDQINKIINDYFKKNTAMRELLTEREQDDYRKRIQTYYNTYVGKKWKEFVKDIQANWLTWDNYGLSVTILYIIHYLRLTINGKDNNMLAGYKKYLIDAITTLPTHRISCENTMMKMKELFGNVGRSETVNINKQIRKISKNKENREDIATNVLSSIKNELIIQKEIYKVTTA